MRAAFHQTGRWHGKAVLALLLSVCALRAQLPVARLHSIFPPGSQIGINTVVKINGADLDDLSELRFSNPGITGAKNADGQFTALASTNVSPGIYEARVIGRFGASNPRAFVVGDRPEVPDADTNKSFAAAQEISPGSVVNGRANPAAPDFFRLKLAKGQRLIFDCLAREIDSRMDPVMVLFNSAGREVGRARTGGPLDFTAPAEGDYILKLHDSQFRGGDEYWYRLDARSGPWIDFVFPSAIEPGAKSKITLFGRNLPGGTASRCNGLEKLDVEVEAPREGISSYLANLPEDAEADVFEYRLNSPNGSSNPALISLATAAPVLETDEPIQTVAPPCEIQGQFYPENDVDVFQFSAAKGEVYWIEIFSQRLGLNTDPFAVIQLVTKNDKGEEKISDVQEMYDSDANIGGNELNTATRDPAWRLEAKEDATYRIRVRDLFAETIADPRRVYRLSIRREAPDFRLIAYPPAPPPLNKDSKEITSWGAFLRRDDTIPIRVLALRRDGYSGEIDVTAESLPTGVSAAPLKLPAGSASGFLMLSATKDAPNWTGALGIVGRAKIGDREIRRTARAAAILWNVSDYNNEAVQSHLTHESLLTVSGGEVASLALRAAADKPVEVVAGAKANLSLEILRRGDFNGPLKFKTLFEPAKEFEVDGKATNATFELDLSQTKLAPGIHSLPLYATSPGKYRRITSDEAKATEEELKKIKESLTTITEAAKKEAANNQIKALEARLKQSDVTATVYASVPVAVAPAPQKAP